MKLEIYPTKQEVAIQFSRYLAIVIAANKEVHIALSGGSTPKIVFDELAANFQSDIDWSGVHLYWGDERCVPPDDVESNYKMTIDYLVSKIDIPSKNVHRMRGENAPEYEAKRYAELLLKNLPKKNGIPYFDLVILGMGDDGHTASIFPNSIDLWYSEKLCEVAVHPDSGQQRITLTGKVINNAETVVFLVTGNTKAQKVDQIINKKEDYEMFPAALVAPTSGNLVWFLDAAASSLLNGRKLS